MKHMNNQQRNYLIDQIKTSVNEEVKALEHGIPKEPNIPNMLLSALANGELRIKPENELLDMLRARSVKNSSDHWLDSNRSSFSSKNIVTFNVFDFFIIPDSVRAELEKHKSDKQAIQCKIDLLKTSSQALITRIMLASNKTLDCMVAQVDNMGDIQLADLTLKSLMLNGNAIEQMALKNSESTND